MRAVVSHPVLGGSEELRVFLRCKADLSTAPRWQMWMQERAGPLDALIKSWTAHTADGAGAAGQGQLLAADGAGGGSSAAAADGAKARPALFMRMKHSLMGVARPKPKQEVSDEELKLRQSKEMLK